MKCLFKALALLAVFATANFAYADKVSMCQVSRDADQGITSKLDINDIDMNVICDEDYQMNLMIKSDAGSYINDFTKWFLELWGYKKKITIDVFSLKEVFDVAVLPLFLLIIAVAAVVRTLWGLGTIVWAHKFGQNNDQQRNIAGLVTYIVIILICALSFIMHSYVRTIASIATTVAPNAISNTALYAMATEVRESKDPDLAEIADVIGQMETSSQNLIRNAIVEENSKYTCLQMKAVDLARSDYLSFKNTSSTAKEIYDNFQNNVKFVFEPESKNGVVFKYNANWNINFEDYREEKYCSQSIGFDVTNDEYPTSLSVFDSDDVAESILQKGEKDGSTFMNSGRMKQQLSKYENEAYDAIRNGTIKRAVRATDDLTTSAASAIEKGMSEVEQILINEKVDSSLYGHYLNGYVNTWTATVKGISNSGDLINTKFDYVRKHALYTKTWNCSQNFDAGQSTRFEIKKLNSKGSGSNFADVSDIIPKINWQCATIKDGTVIYTGTDDKAKVTEFGDRALAIAMAVKMFDSRLNEGSRRGSRAFQPKSDKLESDILSLAKYGRGAFGQASIPFRQMAEIKSKRITAVNNSFSSTMVSGINEAYIDEMMLFGSEKDSKDLKDNPFYKDVLANIQPTYVESFIDESKGKSGIAYETVKVKEKSSGLMEMAKAFFENSFDYNESMKRNLGMNPNLSYEAGYNECKTSTACNNRYSGTLSDIVVNGGQEMFGANAKFYMALQLLEVAKGVGNLGSIVDIGFDGGNAVTKTLSKVLSFVGKGAAIIIGLLHSLLSWMAPLVQLAMVITFIAGWVIPMLEPVMSIIQIFNTTIAYWMASIIFVYKLGKAGWTGSFYHVIDGYKAYATVALVSMFATFGMVFVQWATKSVTVGNELRPLLGITSDVFLVGSILGSMAIQAVALVLYGHILMVPTKAAQIGERVMQSKMNMSDSHSQQDQLKGYLQGWVSRALMVRPAEPVKTKLAQKLNEKRSANQQQMADSKNAGNNPKPKQTEAL